MPRLNWLDHIDKRRPMCKTRDSSKAGHDRNTKIKTSNRLTLHYFHEKIVNYNTIVIYAHFVKAIVI